MNKDTTAALQISALISLMITSIINTIIVIGKEESTDFKNFFVGITGHHWTGHGVVIFILFVVLMVVGYFLVQKDIIKKDLDIYKLAWITIVIVAASELAIFLFMYGIAMSAA